MPLVMVVKWNPKTIDLSAIPVLMAMIMNVDAAEWRPMLGQMLYHKIAYAWTTMSWYWNSVCTYDTWFVCDNRRACACGDTNLRIVCTPYNTLHTEMVSPTNGCVCAVFDQIRWQTFCHIHHMDKHEPLCADFEYVVANLMRRWIPAKTEKNRKFNRSIWLLLCLVYWTCFEMSLCLSWIELIGLWQDLSL